MRRFSLVVIVAVAVLVALSGGAACHLYRAAQREPAFYREAMRAPLERQAEAGEQLEQSVHELRQGVLVPGRWEAVFTDEQINGWLAVDFPEKFPNTLPKGVEHPRVAIRDGQVNIAARFQDKLISSVVSIILDLRLTDEPNTVAVTIKRIRAGALPVSVQQFLDRISRTAARNGIALRWSVDEGDPVALVVIPSRHDDYLRQEIIVEQLEFREGEVYLAGRTKATSPASATTVAQHSPVDTNGRKQMFHR